MMKWVIAFFVNNILIFSIQSQEVKEINTKIPIQNVTVFINGAQIFRKQSIELEAGKTNIKFSDLSPYMDAKSIQVRADGPVTVLSVSHQMNYLDSAKVSNDLKKLEERIKTVHEKRKVENVQHEVIDEELGFLKDNRILSGKDQALTLQNLKETSTYYRDKMQTLKMKLIEINNNKEKYEQDIKALQNQIEEFTSSKIISKSEVLVKVDAKEATKCSFEITYIVRNAGWYPSYDVRATGADSSISVIYKANVHQNTKEEWKNIQLRLSSSNPNSGNIATKLKPYLLDYNNLPPVYTLGNNEIKGRITDEVTREPLPGAIVVLKGTTIGTTSDKDGNFSMPPAGNASEIVVDYEGYVGQTVGIHSGTINVMLQEDTQTLNEVVVVGYGTQDSNSEARREMKAAVPLGKARKLSIPVEVAPVENKTSFEFNVKIPYSVASDNKNTTVEIQTYELYADLEYYCAPKVDRDAFLMAHILGWEKYSLLDGEANIFTDNTFIGKSVLAFQSITDTLKLSLGRDKNVVIQREKIQDFTSRQFLGTKKEETKGWKISVKNNKSRQVHLLLYDQVPVSQLEEISVEVEDISGAKLNKETGEVRWDLHLKPGAVASLQLKYRVKYPKNKILTVE